jgi:uncharacterized MAPEG superfamily protein
MDERTLARFRNCDIVYWSFQQYCVPVSIIALTRANFNYVRHFVSSAFFCLSSENSTSDLSWAAAVFLVLRILFLYSFVNDLHTSN